MTQIERIRKMEERMDRAAEVLRELSDALDRFADVQDDVRALEGYYASELWIKDFADAEAGLLPANLKRGRHLEPPEGHGGDRKEDVPCGGTVSGHSATDVVGRASHLSQ